MKICKKLSKNYAMELYIFNRIDRFKNGITFFAILCSLEYEKDEDHMPQFNCHLTLFNVEIFEFNFYNVNHANNE